MGVILFSDSQAQPSLSRPGKGTRRQEPVHLRNRTTHVGCVFLKMSVTGSFDLVAFRRCDPMLDVLLDHIGSTFKSIPLCSFNQTTGSLDQLCVHWK